MFTAAKKSFFLGILPLTLELGSLDAVTSTWTGTISGDLAVPGNWSPATVPTGAGDTAIFDDTATNFSLIFNSNLSLGQIQFNGTTPYGISPGGPVTLNVLGNISNNDASIVQTFSWNDVGGTLTLDNNVSNNTVAASDVFYTMTASNTLNFSGNSIGHGTVFLLDSGLTGATMNLNGSGSTVQISRLDTEPNSAVHIGSNNLTISSNGSTTINSPIDSTAGGVLTVQGGIDIQFGTNPIAVPINLLGGTIHGDTFSFVDDIANNDTVFFNQNVDGTYASSMSGTGVLESTGSARLNFTGDSSTFTGTAAITNGNFALNGLLGGAITVSNATISGTGTASDQLQILNGGTISPGNSIGTFNVTNDYFQEAGSFYVVEIDGSGASDLINVGGLAIINGGEVIVSSPDGTFAPNHLYTILTADRGVNGRYDSLSSLNNFFPLQPTLSYDANNVYLELASQLLGFAKTFNEQQVANQLDLINNNDPEQVALLTAILALPSNEIPRALDRLSGEQHANDLVATGMIARGFLRRMYDPLRPLVTSECGRTCECSDYDVWFEGGGGRSYLNPDSNAFGYKMNYWELTAGIQKTFCDIFTVGVAGSYEHDKLHYHLGGTGKMDTGFVGLYGLYRPSCFYVLADLAYGHGDLRIDRPIGVGEINFSAKSNPTINDLAFYVESGIDLPLECVLLQPFVGLETNSYWRNGVSESLSNFSDFGLSVKSRDQTNVSSRLGIHFTITNWPAGLALSVDAAWQCRLTPTRNTIKEHFADFGDEFSIKGVRLNRNSAEGAITLSSQITDCFNVYAELYGEAWDHASIYGLLGGLQVSF